MRRTPHISVEVLPTSDARTTRSFSRSSRKNALTTSLVSTTRTARFHGCTSPHTGPTFRLTTGSAKNYTRFTNDKPLGFQFVLGRASTIEEEFTNNRPENGAFVPFSGIPEVVQGFARLGEKSGDPVASLHEGAHIHPVRIRRPEGARHRQYDDIRPRLHQGHQGNRGRQVDFHRAPERIVHRFREVLHEDNGN